MSNSEDVIDLPPIEVAEIGGGSKHILSIFTDTPYLLAYITITIIFFLYILYSVYVDFPKYIEHSKNKTIFGPFITIISLFIWTLLVVYVSWKINNPGIYIIYILSLTMFFINLSVRVQLYNNKNIHRGNGTFYFIIVICTVLYLFYNTYINESSDAWLMLIVALWMLIVLYEWLF